MHPISKPWWFFVQAMPTLCCKEKYPMIYVIFVFGIFMLVSGAIILVNPDPVLRLFHRNSEALGLHVLAIAVRLILGIALATYASESKYPVALKTLGWISIIAAIILGLMGRSRFKGLINWALGFAPSYMRIGGGLAILLGGFIIYAVA